MVVDMAAVTAVAMDMAAVMDTVGAMDTVAVTSTSAVAADTSPVLTISVAEGWAGMVAWASIRREVPRSAPAMSEVR